MQKGHLLVFTTAVVSGLSIFLNKYAVTGIDSSAFTFSKNLLVGIFILFTILFLGEYNTIKTLRAKQIAQLVVIGLVGGSIPFLLFFKGLQLTSAATAAFIHKTMFIYVAVLAWLFLKEKITKPLLFGGALLLFGNYLALRITQVSIDTGALLVFLATILWAVENTLSKKVLHRLPSRIVVLGRMMFGALFIAIYLLFTGASFSGMLSLGGAGWVLFTSGLLLIYVITWYEGLRTVNVSVATCILMLGSVITSALQFLFSGTVLSLTQGVGLVFIVLGVFTVALLSEKSKLPEQYPTDI